LRVKRSAPDHYATLGLDRRCTPGQVRSAYRLLAKQFHPDLNQSSADALAQTQAINAAYEVLSDVRRREEYDRERETLAAAPLPKRAAKADRNLAQEVHLRLGELLRGTSLEVRIKDPAHPDGQEVYDLRVPPLTAPGTRFKLPRAEPFAGGVVLIRIRLRPDFRFKARGTDLRCDLRITAQRATAGGTEFVTGPTGNRLRVEIPRQVERGAVVRIAGEGLPKPRGGRGDLLVRIQYRPGVRVTRKLA